MHGRFEVSIISDGSDSAKLDQTLAAGLRLAVDNDALGRQQTELSVSMRRQGVDVEVGAGVVGRFHHWRWHRRR